MKKFGRQDEIEAQMMFLINELTAQGKHLVHPQDTLQE